MIKPINHDQILLQQHATPATRQDLNVGIDLKDTLNAHQAECIGMAANMIGINKAIIIASLGPINMVMYNPQITQKKSHIKSLKAASRFPEKEQLHVIVKLRLPSVIKIGVYKPYNSQI